MTQTQTGTTGGKTTQAQTGMRAGEGGVTGIDNVTYDIVSVVYHALQAAQTYQQYERDAQRGNTQIAEFFRKVCDNNKQCAQEGLQLLQRSLSSPEAQAQPGQGEAGEAGQYGRGMR